jgi:hypothetical protein
VGWAAKKRTKKIKGGGRKDIKLDLGRRTACTKAWKSEGSLLGTTQLQRALGGVTEDESQARSDKE